MDPFDQFEAYATIADQLINELSKPQVAECSRCTSPTIDNGFGEIPPADLLHLGDVVQIGDEQAALLRDGMEVLRRIPRERAGPSEPQAGALGRAKAARVHGARPNA